MTLSSTAIDPSQPPRFVRKQVSIPTILGELWRARDLVGQFVLRDVTIRYTQAVMGFAWALLMPILIVSAGLVFRLVVATLANVPIEGSSVASLMVKAIPWAFFSGGISVATQSVLGQANLIGKIYFPRESLPIASILAQGTDVLVGLTLLVILLPLLGVGLHWTALWVLLLIATLFVFTIGCALLLSCANLFFRDVKYIVQVVLNFGVFATPVFFEPQMLGKKGAALMLALPLSPFIEGMDLAMVRRHNLLLPLTVSTAKGPVLVWAPWMLAYAAALSCILLCIGLIVFRRASSRFAEMA